MKELVFSGEVGWEITANDIRDQLKAISADEDIRISVDSPGGSVFEMVTIYNLIRDFARSHKGTITTYIQGLAASCASVIALAAKDGNFKNKVTVEDNSIFMIHNAWSVSIGDKREMEDQAAILTKIDNMLSGVYQRITGKNAKQIQTLMDAESWYFGDEIVNAGFADEVISTHSLDDADTEGLIEAKKSMIISAKAVFKKMKSGMQDRAEKELEKIQNSRACACAVLTSDMDSTTYVSSENTDKPESSGRKTEDSLMNKEELKAKYPELYDEVYKEGQLAERERVNAHLKMAEDSGDISAAKEFIGSGAGCAENACVAKYHEVFTKNALAKARVQDNVPPTVVPPSQDEGEKAEVEAFFRETGLRG